VRTTVNISDDLLVEAKLLATQSRRPLGAVIDDALRVLLKGSAAEPGSAAWSFPTAGVGGLRPGVNLEDREALAELLDDNALP
jgi:hypothetical protein